MHAPACDTCCSTLTMLLALGWTEIHGHSVLGKMWLRIYPRVYPGGTLGTVCAKTVCSESLTACSYGRTAFVLSFLPFQEDTELRVETAIFCEGFCGIAAYTCLEMDAVLLRGCTGAIPVLPCPRWCCTGQCYWVRVALGQKGNERQ